MARPRKSKPTQPESAAQLTDGVTEPVTENVTPPVTENVTAAEPLPDLAPLPEPSQEVLDAPPPSTPGNDTPTSTPATDTATTRPEGHRSPSGEIWNPAIHEDPPRIAVRTGSWARRRGGAGAAGGTAPRAQRPIAPGAQGAQAPVLTAELEKKLKVVAATAAGTIFVAGEMLIGKCMKPEPDERDGIIGAFEEYFRSVGVYDIPPWLTLAAALGVYTARRWREPEFVACRAKLMGKGEEVQK